MAVTTNLTTELAWQPAALEAARAALEAEGSPNA